MARSNIRIPLKRAWTAVPQASGMCSRHEVCKHHPRCTRQAATWEWFTTEGSGLTHVWRV